MESKDKNLKIVPLEIRPRPWDQQEINAFSLLFQIRVDFGRKVIELYGISEKGWPIYSICTKGGEELITIQRDRSSPGYRLDGKNRRIVYIRDINQLVNIYGFYEPGTAQKLKIIEKTP